MDKKRIRQSDLVDMTSIKDDLLDVTSLRRISMEDRRPPSPGRESLARRDIVKKMQQEHLKDLGLSNKILTQVVNAFIETYKEAILEHKRVEIRNFGVINSELVRARQIKHPETGEILPASPYYRLSFKPSAAFREQLKAKALKEVQKL